MLQHVGFIEYIGAINFRNPLISFCDIALTMAAPSVKHLKIIGQQTYQESYHLIRNDLTVSV